MELKKTLGSPLDSKEIKPSNLKEISPEYIAKTDTETPILWSPDVKSQFLENTPDAGKDRGQEEKGVKEDEMVVWHHQLNEHEFEQAS